jgi:hypothetical protein
MTRVEDIVLLLPFRPVSPWRSMSQTYSTFELLIGCPKICAEFYISPLCFCRS